MIDLFESLINIQIHIIRCQYNGNDLTPRLIAWAIAALVREGRDEARVRQMLGDRPLARQWWLLRQMLSDKAIATLETKLRTVADGTNASRSRERPHEDSNSFAVGDGRQKETYLS